MKIGTIVDDASPSDSVRRGILAERLGFESLWFADHLVDAGGIKIDPWTTMGAVASSTSRIKMCTSVSDTQRIHPAKLAHIVATLGELSNGRAWLGIGAGEAMNIVPFGIAFDEPKIRVQRLAEAIQVVRLLWQSSRQNPVSFKGSCFSLENAWCDLEVKETPSVYVGALGGRRALEVAGRYGDGWVSWLNTPTTFSQKLEIARSASGGKGRESPSKFEACVWIYTALTDDEEDVRRALNRAKRGLLAEANTLKMMGFSRPKELGESFQNMLLSDESARRFSEAQDAVPDEFASECIAVGNPAQVIERLEEFGKAGATRALIHFVSGGDDQVDQFSKKVLPHFRG